MYDLASYHVLLAKWKGTEMEVEIPFATREKWFACFPIDGDGIPTSDAAYQLIQFLFDHRNEAFSPEELGKSLLLHPALVRCMCRQLLGVRLLSQEPHGANRFRYLVDSPNMALQINVENALLEYPAIAARLNRPTLPAA